MLEHYSSFFQLRIYRVYIQELENKPLRNQRIGKENKRTVSPGRSNWAGLGWANAKVSSSVMELIFTLAEGKQRREFDCMKFAYLTHIPTAHGYAGLASVVQEVSVIRSVSLVSKHFLVIVAIVVVVAVCNDKFVPSV